MTEHDAFREAMQDVTPLEQNRVEPAPRSREVTPAEQTRRDAALGLRPDPGRPDANPLTLGEVRLLAPRDLLSWKQDGVQREVFRKLRTGKYAPDASLDLHHHRVHEAQIAMYRFFALARLKGWRTVLIAHGRGEQSATPARIKSYVAHWLTQLPDVIAFHSAAAHQGGTGAVCVLLKKDPEARELARERYGVKTTDSGR